MAAKLSFSRAAQQIHVVQSALSRRWPNWKRSSVSRCRPFQTPDRAHRRRRGLPRSRPRSDPLADGRMDLALVSIQSSPSPLVALRELTREPMVLVCVTRWRPARACNSPNSTHKISSSSRSGGEYANASTPVSPPPEFIRSMRTRLPTMRSSPNSSDTDSRRRSCPSAPQTGFRTYIKFLCVHR